MENEKRKGRRGRLLGLIPALLLAALVLLTGCAAARSAAEPGERSAEPYLGDE